MEDKIKNNIKKSFPVLSTYLSYVRARRSIKTKYEDRNINDLQKYLDHIRRDGYVIVPNFYSKSECSQIREITENLMSRNSHLIQKLSDDRLFGAEQFDRQILDFHSNKIASRLASCINHTESRPAFTLAGRLSHVKSSSGEGWHRDAFYSQFKAMVYLTDVDEFNGPFEILKGSHRLGNILRDMKIAKLDFHQYRLENIHIETLVNSGRYTLNPLTGPAGTLIYFDSSAIHRGRPLEQGYRVSLTTYFYEKNRIGPDLFKKFNIPTEN